jgi:deoxycytidine triphosphate deaminase
MFFVREVVSARSMVRIGSDIYVDDATLKWCSRPLVLSDRDIKAKLIRDKEEAGAAIKIWEESRWDQDTFKDRIVVDPFSDKLIGPVGYELRVGTEYLSLRDPYNTKKLDEGDVLTIDPSETVLVLTEEYLCLPKTIAGSVVPKARHIFTGLVLNTTRVEPTWYGKLVVGITNVGKNPLRLMRGETFAVCQFSSCTEVEKPLTVENTPHLGRRTIGTIDFRGMISRMPMDPESVTRGDMKKVVEMFGYPWDIVDGMIRRTQEEVVEHISRDVAPGISEEAVAEAVKVAFKRQTDLMIALVAGLLALLTAIVLRFLHFL